MAVKKACNDLQTVLNAELRQFEELSKKYNSPFSDSYKVVRERARLLQGIINNTSLWTSSEVEPVITSDLTVIESGWRDGWLYQNCLYEVTGTYTDEEKKLLIMEYCDKERQKFERLKAKFNSEASQEIKRERLQIPEEVRIAVWRRDQGKCVRCGSRENLEYDHIVPVSKGGSNTVRNVELLCESCNRQKGDRIQ